MPETQKIIRNVKLPFSITGQMKCNYGAGVMQGMITQKKEPGLNGPA
jgi:hypothetical protein